MPEAIDWEKVAKHLNYPGEKEMWTDLYTDKKLSVGTLEEMLGVSRPTIRAAIKRCGIPFRSRGGPQNLKVRITDEQLLQEVGEYGVRNVAFHYNVSMTCITTRVKQAKAKRAEAEAE